MKQQTRKSRSAGKDKLSEDNISAKDTCRKRMKPLIQSEQNPYEQIPQIPNVRLTVEDMNSDPIALLNKLQKQYAQYGAVRLTTSDNWNCPFTFRYVDKGITTRIQKLQSLKAGKAFEQNVEAYNINSFQSFAKNFQHTYKFRTSPSGSTLETKKQQEYWRLVTMPQYEKKEVKVQYAADLPSIRYGSGFPTSQNHHWKDSDFVYEKNLFNLNNIMKSENSLLKITQERKQKISGITHPWVYMGMMFSSFCWHVQDLWVNSINYSHKGSIKTWYFVPGDYKEKFDEYITKKYCQSSFKKTLLQRITFMVDPLQLIQAGIPVYKTNQRPRDYVCTFFKAYHCGFSQGYNIGEAINFVSPMSLSVMVQAKIAKKKLPKLSPNVIPLEWLILQNFKKIDKFTIEKAALNKLYHEMIKQQKKQLDEVLAICEITGLEIIPGKAKYDKIMCSQCKEYLYLEGYRFDNGKIFCYEHLTEAHQKLKLEDSSIKSPKLNVQILFREPNDDRAPLIKQIKIKSKFHEEENKKTN